LPRGAILKSVQRLFVGLTAIFHGGVNHGVDVFRLGLVEERPVTHDVAAARGTFVDEFFDVVLHLLWRAQD